MPRPTEDEDWTTRLMPEAEITAAAGRAVVMGATNCDKQLDEAARCVVSLSIRVRPALRRLDVPAGPDAVDAPSGRRPGEPEEVEGWTHLTDLVI
jgi:hypothetical protein